MKISFLGVSAPIDTLRGGQAGSGVLIQARETSVLVDCGPGVTNKFDVMELDVRAVNAVVLTHHHWDHIADLPFFILGRWEKSLYGEGAGDPRAPALSLYGPNDTKRIADRFFGPSGAYSGDMATRLAPEIGGALYSARGAKLPLPPIIPEVTEVTAGDEWSVGSLKIRAAEARHCQPYLLSLAYRFEAKEGIVVVTGDTVPCESVELLAAGADILVHECYFNRDFSKKLGRSIAHSTNDDVARVAAAAKVSRLVLVHHGIAPEDDDAIGSLTDRIRSGYSGEITIATGRESFEL